MKLKLRKRLFWFPNRKYKDRLFRRVFENKKDLLDLYNAMNGTNYENEDDLEITTLENVIYMSMKNDISFIVSSTMSLYEHQSTVNYNMPLRGLLYLARLYDSYIKGSGLNMYGRKLIKLPLPQYIVFYNGRESFPDQSIMKLSDAFERPEGSQELHPALECEARIINVNYGHNKELMEKCQRLMHYSIFIDTVNKYQEQNYLLEDAISLAIDECLEKGILVDILERNRGEISHMLLTEFNQKEHDKNTWQDGHDEGYAEGFGRGEKTGFDRGEKAGFDRGEKAGFDRGEKAGFDRGEKAGFDRSIVMMLQNGKTPEEIAEFTGYQTNKIIEIAETNNIKVEQ